MIYLHDKFSKKDKYGIFNKSIDHNIYKKQYKNFLKDKLYQGLSFSALKEYLRDEDKNSMFFSSAMHCAILRIASCRICRDCNIDVVNALKPFFNAVSAVWRSRISQQTSQRWALSGGFNIFLKNGTRAYISRSRSGVSISLHSRRTSKSLLRYSR